MMNVTTWMIAAGDQIVLKADYPTSNDFRISRPGTRQTLV